MAAHTGGAGVRIASFKAERADGTRPQHVIVNGGMLVEGFKIECAGFTELELITLVITYPVFNISSSP